MFSWSIYFFQKIAYIILPVSYCWSDFPIRKISAKSLWIVVATPPYFFSKSELEGGGS